VAEYASVTGSELARVLAGDGWTPQSTDLLPVNVVLWKDGGNKKPIPICLPFLIGKNRVERICKKAGVSPTRFEDLLVNAPLPVWLVPSDERLTK
jgi:hypothetical protein